MAAGVREAAAVAKGLAVAEDAAAASVTPLGAVFCWSGAEESQGGVASLLAGGWAVRASRSPDGQQQKQ